MRHQRQLGTPWRIFLDKHCKNRHFASRRVHYDTSFSRSFLLFLITSLQGHDKPEETWKVLLAPTGLGEECSWGGWEGFSQLLFKMRRSLEARSCKHLEYSRIIFVISVTASTGDVQVGRAHECQTTRVLDHDDSSWMTREQ